VEKSPEGSTRPTCSNDAGVAGCAGGAAGAAPLAAGSGDVHEGRVPEGSNALERVPAGRGIIKISRFATKKGLKADLPRSPYEDMNDDRRPPDIQ